MNLINVTGMEGNILAIYADMNERQLKTIYEPDKNGLFIAESPNVILRALDDGYMPESILIEERVLEHEDVKLILDRIRSLNVAEKASAGIAGGISEQASDEIPVYVAATEVLLSITGYKLTKGVLCAMRRRELPDYRDICRAAKRIAVLEEVMNPVNIGSIFRSAAALNMDAVLLTPGCSDPLYRRSCRVSMGTVFQVPWTYICKDVREWQEKGIELLHEIGFKSVAMALKPNSLNIDDSKLKEEPKLAVVMGTEGEGLANSTITECDYTVMIPMAHGVDSLNVAAASSVAFWELSKTTH